MIKIDPDSNPAYDLNYHLDEFYKKSSVNSVKNRVDEEINQ